MNRPTGSAANTAKRIRWVFRLSAQSVVTPNDNGSSEEKAHILESKLQPHCARFAFQLESAPTTGYLHFQGMFELTIKKAFTWIQNNIMHFEYLNKMLGTPFQAWAYSTKQETRVAGPWTFGPEPSSEERSSKVDQFVKDCMEGHDDETLWNNHPSTMARMEKVPDRIRGLKKPTRLQPLKVWVFFGAAGVGKSYAARELFPDIYDVPVSSSGRLWFTQRGNKAKTVLFDDFSGAASKIGLKEFNRLLDPYPLELEKKNGYIWYCPETIIISTNVKPSLWYNFSNREDVYSQIKRRITGIYDFNTPLGRDLMESLSCDELDARYPTAPSIRPIQHLGYAIPRVDAPFPTVQDLDGDLYY